MKAALSAGLLAFIYIFFVNSSFLGCLKICFKTASVKTRAILPIIQKAAGVQAQFVFLF
jgi:hypothetical protein